LKHLGNIIKVPGEPGHGILVSATGPIAWQDFDRLASYSNYGSDAIWVAAPGGDNLYPNLPYSRLDKVLSTYPNASVAWMIGTSQATPMVSGVAALILSNYGPMSVSQLKNRIAQTADDLGKPGKDDSYGNGRVNAYNAVTNTKK
jgi:subtilisin family serine protease